MFDRTRELLVARILDGLGMANGTGLSRLAVRGWLGMVEEATVSWLRERSVEREELVWLLNETLVRIVAAVVAPPGPAGR